VIYEAYQDMKKYSQYLQKKRDFVKQKSIKRKLTKRRNGNLKRKIKAYTSLVVYKKIFSL